MTQEDKELLIRDLCARLPYGVKCKIENSEIYNEKLFDKSIVGKLNGIFNNSIFIGETTILQTDKIEKLKPYLRPMSSMTEEDLRNFAVLKFKNNDIWEINGFPEMKFGFKGFINIQCRNKNSGDTSIYQVNTRTPLETYWGIDWLNAHHFDYRGLIEKGLALEAPDEMYN